MNLTLPDPQYAKPSTRLNFHEQIWPRLAAMPGVQAAALVSHVPYSEGGGIGEDNIAIEGRAPGQRGEIVSAIIETATPNYFGLMNIALRDGRLLNESDGAESQRSCGGERESGAPLLPCRRKSAGQENQVGKAGGEGSADHPWMTVVGVVSDVHYSWIDKDDQPTLYRSFRQAPPYFTTVVLRTQGDPLKFVSAARSQIAAVDPDLPLYNIKPMEKVITESIVGIAYVAAMMAVLGVIALVLASVGVFGVMSYSVSERAHEIGIRMSMGAQSRDVLELVLRSGMTLTLTRAGDRPAGGVCAGAGHVVVAVWRGGGGRHCIRGLAAAACDGSGGGLLSAGAARGWIGSLARFAARVICGVDTPHPDVFRPRVRRPLISLELAKTTVQKSAEECALWSSFRQLFAL